MLEKIKKFLRSEFLRAFAEGMNQAHTNSFLL